MVKTLALLSSVSVLLLLGAWSARVGQPQVCIKSPLVYQLDIAINKEAQIKVVGCGYPQESQSRDSVVRNIVAQVNGVVEHLPHQLGLMGLELRHPLALKVHLSQPLSHSVSSKSIELGIDVLEAQGQLESALLRAVIRQVRPILRTELHEILLIDLIRFSSQGVMGSFDPVLGKGRWDTEEDSWNQLLQIEGRSSICVSPWRLPSSWDGCQASERSNEVAAETLRPLVLDLMRRHFSSTPLLERVREVRDWTKWDDRLSGLLPELGALRTQEDLWKLAEAISGESIHHEPSHLALKSDIIIEGALDRPGIQEWIFENFKGKRVVLMSREGIRLRPHGPWLSHTASVSSSMHLILSCKTPKADAIANSHVERIVVLNVCEGEIKSLDSLMSQRWSEFALENPGAKFKVIHRDSLRLAIQMGLPIQAILQGGAPRLSKRARSLVGSQHFQIDERSGLTVNRGPLAVLEFFRL